MKLAILTDSGANFTQEFIKKHSNLFVVPLMIVVDGKSFRDQIEITASEVYEKIDEKDFSTSLPEPSDLQDAIKKIKKEGYTDLLVINISSGLSGTYNAFRIELEQVKGINITQYDTKTIGAGQGYLVEQALELAAKGKDVETIMKALVKQRAEEQLALYTINTLKYLKKGGRIGKVEGTIGDMLRIKPVVSVNEDGVYITLAKAFGIKRSLMNMKNIFVEKFKGFKIDLTVHYGSGKEKAEELAEAMVKLLDVRNLVLSPLTPVMGIHTGPEMFSYVGRIIK